MKVYYFTINYTVNGARHQRKGVISANSERDATNEVRAQLEKEEHAKIHLKRDKLDFSYPKIFIDSISFRDR